jgi:hypothetical protein
MSEESILEPDEIFLQELPLDYAEDLDLFLTFENASEITSTIEKKTRSSTDACDFVAT